MTRGARAAKQSAPSNPLALAERTPASRNRYVDFLRALSIIAVVAGHWLIAAPWIEGGELRLSHMLELQPWTRWLTWVFQVMPIFFMVGGYSNAASWDAALRDGRPYGAWLASRLQRLIGPMVPLLAFWSVVAMIAHQAGVSPAMIRVASQAALVATWFLAVYILAVLLVPATREAWRRFGMASFAALAVAAAVVDASAFIGNLAAIRWTNYGFIWLAVHQLGYAWRDGRMDRPVRCLIWAAAGLLGLVSLVTVAGYPSSMVGVPGEEVSNTLPPTLAMLALGCAQGGLLLALQGPAQRWLARARPWAATILVNGVIMTVYLWHLTALICVIALLEVTGRFGLTLIPGSGAWWSTRPVWMALLAVALYPFLVVFARFERPTANNGLVATWRSVAGAILVGACLALLALHGIGGTGPLGIRSGVLLMGFAGAALAGAIPRLRGSS